MLAPGATFSAGGRIEATIGAATVPDFFNEGVGYMDNGDIAIDTDTPAGSFYRNGIRQSEVGAFYGTTSANSSDVWIEGIRVSAEGAIVYEVADPTFWENGNPFTSNGRLALN